MEQEIIKKRKRRSKKRRRRITLLVILAVLIVALAAAAFFVMQSHVLIGGKLYSRDVTQIDARGTNVSVNAYEELHAKLPDCDILWDVPIGSESADCTAESVSFSTLNSDNLEDLLYFRNLKSLDATASELTVEDYNKLCALLPGTEIRWSVPLSGGRFASDSETITPTALSADDLPLLSYFTALKTVDCRSCADYETILTLRESQPELQVLWQVPLSGSSYLQDAEEVSVDSTQTSADELLKTLRYLPNVKKVSVPGCTYTDEEQTRLMAERPDVTFEWPFWMCGVQYTGAETSLSFAGKTISSDDYQQMLQRMKYFSAMQTVDMTGCSLSDEQIFALADTCPDVQFVWTLNVCGVEFESTADFLDFTGVEMESTDAVEAVIPYMHNLTKIDMTDTGFDDETYDAMNQRWENVRVVWTLHITRYNIRTDAVAFRASSEHYGDFDAESVMRLKYCTDMICMDMGHRRITTIDWLYYMPHVRYLILLDCRSNDLTAVGSLKELRYLELNRATAKSLKPLLGCTALEDLNITFLYEDDGAAYGPPADIFETLMELDWVNRVWWTYNQMTEEQAAELQAAHPDILYHETYDWDQSNEDPWRYCRNYYEMRDMLGGPANGVYYMCGTGIIHCKIVDGVTYGEFEDLPEGVD